MLEKFTQNGAILNAEALRCALGKDGEGVALFVHEEIDSTNTEAKRLSAQGYTGRAIIAAERQSAGRGRMGRSFYSPERTGAYFSILYTPNGALGDAVRITSAASVAVMRAIRALTGKQTLIKWVNDLYLDSKKVCGILTEAVTSTAGTQIIVGIGINLSTSLFPQELEGVAGSLNSPDVTVCALIAEIFRELLPYLDDPEDRSWLADYRVFSCVLGREIIWTRGEERFCGIARDVDADGALLVTRSDGAEERLHTGEISIRFS